ncbi:hypothetical protein B5X24_HaOG207527 [Helicoverpa armigera]|nr:hypothetical protein B5X24_HaOG207527 [Helicoverpa armigera]
MANKGKWKLDTTLKFIHCYKLHECLWKFTSPDYKNKKKRDVAYIAIVNKMNIKNFGIQEVKNKIKNLRSTYSQELKKIENSKKSGAGLDHVYISNIKWLKEMEEVFMSELKRKRRNTYKNIPSVTLVPEQLVPPESGSQFPAAAGEKISQQPTITTAATTANTPLRPKKRSRVIINAINELKTLHGQVHAEKESSFDVFGKSVAMQLKNFSVENALLAQQKIQCILTEIGIADCREKRGKKTNTSTVASIDDTTESALLNAFKSNTTE